MAIFFALLTLIGWGVGDIFGAIASRKIGNLCAYFWVQIVAFFLMSFYIPFAGGIADTGMFLFAIVIGLIDAWATLFYFRALEIGNASIVGTIGGSFSLVTVLLAVIFFGEVLSIPQTVGIVFTATGVVLTSMNMKAVSGLKFRSLVSDISIRYALVIMIVWGVYFAIVRLPAEKIGWFWTAYPTVFFFLIMILRGQVKKDYFEVIQRGSIFLTILAFCIFVNIGMFAYNLGILSGYTSIVAPIAGASPVLFVFLARIIFKEPLTKQQSFGIILSLLGILLISSPLQ